MPDARWPQASRQSHYVNFSPSLPILHRFLDRHDAALEESDTWLDMLTSERRIERLSTPEFIRLCVGIEDVRDIQADLDQALRAAQQ